MGPKELVDSTWRAPLRKVVIARWLLELGHTLGCGDLTYIPNAVDHWHYRITRPIDHRLQQVAMVFSLVPLKGARDGIRALEIAKEKFPGLRVSLFGDSRRASWIPKWMTYEENPPQDRIVQKFYNDSSIFLSPSWMEGFSLPPAEAAACGCAIVATDTGGIREYVQNGITGLLSPPHDPEALAKGLCLLLGNDELRVRFARAANSSVRRLNWEQSTDQLEKFMTG
jgi:glycosyltransferase involved in cell wall biosynthesis